MTDQHSNMGDSGFIWFFGKVEDNTNDPLKIGRVRVRAFNIHSPDVSSVPTNTLPWAMISQSPTSAAESEVGISPTGIANNSLCWGFFLDGNHYQQPVVVGTFQGIPNGKSDLTPLATGTNTIPNGTLPGEPPSPYKAQYPHNKVTTTESGHVIELDDTPGAERIRVYHKSGSYTEMGPTGNITNKTAADNYLMIAGKSVSYVGSDLTLSVQGNLTYNVSGTVTINQNVTVNGSIIATGDIIGNGISLDNHVHGGVQGGGNQTSGPIG